MKGDIAEILNSLHAAGVNIGPMLWVFGGLIILLGFIGLTAWKTPGLWKALYRIIMHYENREKDEEFVLATMLSWVKQSEAKTRSQLPVRNRLYQFVSNAGTKTTYETIYNAYRDVKAKKLSWSEFKSQTWHLGLYDASKERCREFVRQELKKDGWPDDKITYIINRFHAAVGEKCDERASKLILVQHSPIDFIQWWGTIVIMIADGTEHNNFLELNGELDGLKFKGESLEPLKGQGGAK